MAVAPPEEIMTKLFGRWLFERENAHSLRVGSGKDVANSSVFSAGIDTVKNDQQRVPVMGKHQIQELIHLLEVKFGFFQGLRFVLEGTPGIRIDALQFKSCHCQSTFSRVNRMLFAKSSGEIPLTAGGTLSKSRPREGSKFARSS
jgi:hypothetical protein